MLLKSVTEDVSGDIIAHYQSSNILSSRYSPTNKELTIIFSNGGKYKYLDVDKTTYIRFETAESQGNVFNSHIKKYTFVKEEKIDVNSIKEEVEALIPKNNETLESLFSTLLLETQLLYNGIFLEKTPTTLNKLKEVISKLEKKLNG